MGLRFTTQADSAPPNGENHFLRFRVYKHLAPTGEEIAFGPCELQIVECDCSRYRGAKSIGNWLVHARTNE